MKLKAVLDTLDGLDEALKALYTERDGKFYLNIEGYNPDELETMRRTLTRVKQEKKDAEAIAAKYADLPDDFMEEYNRLKDSGGGNVDQRLADQRERMNKEKNTAVSAVEKDRDTYKARAEKLASENEISKAMTEANVAPHMQKAVRAMFQGQIKVDYEGDDTIVTINSLPVVDKIKAWAGTDEGKYFVTAPANGGGGAQPGNGGSKDYGKMNNTQLMQLMDKDPSAKAEFERRTKIDAKPMR